MARRSQPRIAHSRNKRLENKLARYAIAGSAVFAAPFATAGSIQYSGLLNEPIDLSHTPVTLPGTPVSFTAFFMTGESVNYFQSIIVNGTSVNFVPNGGPPAALPFGTSISTANATGGGGALLAFNQAGFKGGNWPKNHGPAYVGFEFTTAGQMFTGWADVSVNVDTTKGNPTGTLIDYAYDTVPGESITAGGSTPEPSSLALFALGGAAALGLLRRRRAAQRG